MGGVAFETADDVFYVGGVEVEDSEEIFLVCYELTILYHFSYFFLELGQLGEKRAFADEKLILKAGYLCDLIDEIDNGKRYFNDLYVEVEEHAFELVDACFEEID